MNDFYNFKGKELQQKVCMIVWICPPNKDAEPQTLAGKHYFAFVSFSCYSYSM